VGVYVCFSKVLPGKQLCQLIPTH